MTEPDTERLEQLLQFHERDPADAFIAYGIAMEYVKAANVDRALEWFDKTLAIDGDYAYAWYQKAKLLSDDGRGAEALAAVEQGIAAAGRANDAHAADELRELRGALKG